MPPVKMVTEVLLADRDVSSRWYVSNGTTAVGPIDLELIARGIEAGKVPLESFLRNEMWKVWLPLRELVEPDDGPVSIEPEAPSARGSDPGARIEAPAREDLPAIEAIATAEDARDALLLCMSAVVRELEAEAALLHASREEGVVIVCAHGGDLFDGLGGRLPKIDPAYEAASAGVIVVAEPMPGPAGYSTLRRLRRAGAIDGAVTFPLRPNGEMFGMLEVGRRHAFSPRELAKALDIVDALVARLERPSVAIEPETESIEPEPE